MKQLVLLLMLGMAGPVLIAQNSYTAWRVQPQMGRVALPDGKAPAHALNLEYNLGKKLRKGFEVETGLGLRTQGVRFRYLSSDKKPASSTGRTTMAVLPARVKLRIVSRDEGKNNLWLNLGYLYGHRLFANGWVLVDPEAQGALQHEQMAEQKNFHFAELGLEVDAPLGNTHRIGFGIHYTRSLTPDRESSYFRSVFSLPGFSIRIARRRWRR